MRRAPLPYFSELARGYGDVVYFRMAHKRIYLISHPDTIKEYLVTKSKSFRKTEQVLRSMRRIDGNGLALTEGEFWLRQRRLLQPAFHQKRFAGYAEAMVKSTRNMLDSWTDGEHVELVSQMTHLTLDIVGRTFFGIELSERAGPIAEAVHTMSEVITYE